MQKKVIHNYVLCEPIGSGSFGKVYRGENQKTQEVVAIKVMNNSKFIEVPQLSTFIQNETSILSKISHPNIIKFHKMLKTSHNYYLVYEYCSNGTLEDLLKRQPRHILQEDRAIIIFKQIIAAFRVLVKENILHRDLKPSNILITQDGTIKIADFGFCKALCNSDDMTKTMVGSPVYMAPEILKGWQYTIKADIWSMGVCLFELLFGFCPFEARNIAELIGQISTKQLSIPKHINQISPSTEKLLRSMLVVDSKKRIEWENLLNFFDNESPNENVSIHQKKPLQQIQNFDFQANVKEEIKAKLAENKVSNSNQRRSGRMQKNFSSNNLNYQQHRPTIVNHRHQEKQLTLPFTQNENNENLPPPVPRKIATPNIPTRNIYRYQSYKNLRHDEQQLSRQSSKGRIQNLFGDKFEMYKNYLNRAMNF